MGRPRRLHHWTGALHELIAPSICVGCSRRGAGPLALCARCLGRIRRLRPPRCLTCGRRFAALAGARSVAALVRCAACRLRPPAFDRLLAVWSYEPPFDAVLQALKFGRLEVLGARLAKAMLEPLRLQALESRPCETSELPDADLVVPVPLHWRRQLLRGYNQAESIGRPLARLLGLPFGEALKRPRATAAQAGLGRDHRRANVRQAFRARRPLSGHILLVDDVATTGATLDAAARALRRGGADRVTALAVARTPDPDELAHPPVRPLLRRQSRGIAP